jgi:aryl-alcohol dehydrogenase-like predicted oxidoreductase
MAMRYETIGESGVEASVIGMGTWVTGGWMWGGAEEADSIEAIRAALDLGINLIDTAPIYGFGHSEHIVGKAIAGRRDLAVLLTKCGQVWHTDLGHHAFDDSGKQVYHYLGPESIRYEIEQSLRRLRTDYIDIYMIHVPDPITPAEATMGELLKLKKEGKIRAIGVSNMNVGQLDDYQLAGPIDCDEEKYSMLDRRIEADTVPYCMEYGISVLAYSPLSQGLLTGKVTAERTFAGDDMRKKNQRFEAENILIVNAMLDEFRPLAEAYGLTLAQLAISWTVSNPGVGHVLVGGRNVEQVRENAGAGDVVLGEDVLAEMRDVIEVYTQRLERHPAKV